MKKSSLLKTGAHTTGLFSTIALLLVAGYAKAAPITQNQSDSLLLDPMVAYVESSETKAGTDNSEVTNLDLYSVKALDLISDDHSMTPADEEGKKIPEPSSFVLTGVGMAILMLRRKR